MTIDPLVVVIAPTMAECAPTIEDYPQISSRDKELDDMDEFNKPRLRRALILKALSARSENIVFQTPKPRDDSLLSLYASVHSEGLLTFLMTAWSQWKDLSPDGQNPDACLKLPDGRLTSCLIPSSVPLPRDPHQRSSKNVMGQMGYYCTDNCTPITDALLDELKMDASILQHAVETAIESNHPIVYALPTHPGHHAAFDSFGGYCYLNQAAFAARLFQSRYNYSRVAILDIGKF
jgi:acetoin utilization deacetylase AcuC-like enzyme